MSEFDDYNPCQLITCPKYFKDSKKYNPVLHYVNDPKDIRDRLPYYSGIYFGSFSEKPKIKMPREELEKAIKDKVVDLKFNF